MASVNTAKNNMSLEEMKRLLRNAEQRLKACSPVQTTSNHPTTLKGPPNDISQIAAQKMPRLEADKVTKLYIESNHRVALAQPSRLLSEHTTKSWKVGTPQVNVSKSQKNKVAKGKEPDAGPDWFHLPRTTLTPTLKRELQILKMRSVLDPKRHYKKDDSKALASEFFQVGTIVQGPTEFYNSRIPNRDRKGTIVSEILSSEQSTSRFRNKYNNLQLAKTSGKKAFYRNLKNQRSGRIKKR